jgi:hypothetical protein
MFTKRFLLFVVSTALIAGTFLAANANGQTLLGTRDVRSTIDHDSIPVTATRGEFNRLKFRVSRHGIEFYRVLVHFGNGSTQRLDLRLVIPAGGESRWIGLRGGDRVIQRIDFWYSSRSLFGHRARIRVYGLR